MSRHTRVKWLYRLDENFEWESGLSVPEDLFFVDRGGKVRLIIEHGGRITITRGYAWNGCSPKIFPFDIMLGTPEGAVHRDSGKPKTYHASLVHDALYQFLAKDAPVKRWQADRLFRQLLQDCDFTLAWVYWVAVFACGWLVRRGKGMKRKWRGRRERVKEWVP